MLDFHYGNISAVYRLRIVDTTTTLVAWKNIKHYMMKTESRLKGRSILLVGLMGAGKTAIGRRLAERLGMPFVDADEEIAKAAGCSIEDIFEIYGEQAFRDGERRVIERLLKQSPQVMATGGGAFMDPETRENMTRAGISVWLRADLDLLVERTERRGGRPLLKNDNNRTILEKLMKERYPVYAKADITVDSCNEPHEVTVGRVVSALEELNGPAAKDAGS